MYSFDDFKMLEWEENDGSKIPGANYIQYMDNLCKLIKKEILPTVPSNFKVDYKRGNKITIHTSSKKDLSITIEVSDEDILYNVKPVSGNGPEFETNYKLKNGIEQILRMISDEFEKDPNNGLHKEKEEKPVTKKIKDFDEDDDIDEPITKKPSKISKSIDIRIIKSVLEDSYILDEINLKNLTIEELLRRMLIESRK